MTKLFFFSILMVFAQATLSADNRTHAEDPIIKEWASKRTTEGTFEVSLGAIQSALANGENLDEKRLEFLTQWAEKLLTGQKALKKRAQDWLNDLARDEKFSPHTQNETRLTNLAVMYEQRIKELDKVIQKIKLKQIEEKTINEIRADSLKRQLELN